MLQEAATAWCGSWLRMAVPRLHFAPQCAPSSPCFSVLPHGFTTRVPLQDTRHPDSPSQLAFAAQPPPGRAIQQEELGLKDPTAPAEEEFR